MSVGILVFLIALLVVYQIIKLIVTDYDICYFEMQEKGFASLEQCSGVTGGNRNTNFLSEQCISCPYYTYQKKDKNGEEK